jgi:hypothetical protein
MIGPVPATVDPHDARTAAPFSSSSSMGALGGWVSTGDAPANQPINIRLSSLRLRRTRLPPRTYEGDVGRLYHRLIRNGADPILQRLYATLSSRVA